MPLVCLAVVAVLLIFAISIPVKSALARKRTETLRSILEQMNKVPGTAGTGTTLPGSTT